MKVRPTAALAAIAALTATVVLAGCGSGTSSTSSSSSATGGATAPGAQSGAVSITVGSANFGESVLLMEIYAGALKAKGITVATKPKIGARPVYVPALQDGSIDLIPEYSGSILRYFDPAATAVSSDAVYAALPAAVGADLKVLAQSAAEDKDSIAVTKETAATYNLTSIGDLKPVAGDMVFGAEPQFETRPEGLPGLKEKYGVEFGSFQVTDAGGPVSVTALLNGQVDATDIFTTDPAIAANGFVVLADPENLYAAQNVVPLIRADKATPEVQAALDAVSKVLTTQDLIDLNAKTAAGAAPETVAADWLKAKGLG